MFSSYSSDILIRSLTINNCTNDTNFKSAALFFDELSVQYNLESSDYSE